MRVLVAAAASLTLACPAAAGALSVGQAVAASPQPSVFAPRHPAAVAACAHASISVGPANLGAMRTAVLCLVNRQRAAHGLPRLSEDSRLDRSAQGWTQTMVATHRFTHGTNFAARISAAGFRWSAAGENIATGFATPAAVVKAWMASVGHCRNILSPSYSAIGIGVVNRPVAGFASGAATWTQDFALPMGRRAPSRNFAASSRCPY